MWILRRTPQMLAGLETIEDDLLDPSSERPMQPEYAHNAHRSIKPEYLIAVGICTHLGCSPSEKFAAGAASGLGQDWPGGFLCPATARPSIWPGGCTRTSRLPTTSRFHRTTTCRIRAS